MIKHIVNLSKNKFGILLAKLLLELKKYNEELFVFMKEKIFNNLYNIMNSKYGNYLIQDINNKWKEEDTLPIVLKVFEFSTLFSKTKYSSSTIERYLEKSPKNIFFSMFLGKLLSNDNELLGKSLLLII